MKTAIQTFCFKTDAASSSEVVPSTHLVRVVMQDDQPWFIAIDVCGALGIENSREVTARLDADEKCVVSTDGIHAGAGNPNLTAISESGLYSVILGSRKPEAKPFKRWVTHEVLPSIARTGVYVDKDNKMGESLGAATGDAVNLERPATLADLTSVFAALGSVAQSLGEQNKQTLVFTGALERMLSESSRARRDMQRDFTAAIAKVTRVAGAQRPSNKDLDPNRPLDKADISRLLYLLQTGTRMPEISRRLNRTHSVLRQFVDENQGLITDALRASL